MKGIGGLSKVPSHLRESDRLRRLFRNVMFNADYTSLIRQLSLCFLKTGLV